MLGDLGKLIVAKGFKKLPIVQNIARSGHTARLLHGQNILRPRQEYLRRLPLSDLPAWSIRLLLSTMMIINDFLTMLILHSQWLRMKTIQPILGHKDVRLININLMNLGRELHEKVYKTLPFFLSVDQQQHLWFIIVLFQPRLEQKYRLQWDSNSDRQNWKRAHRPLNHHLNIVAKYQHEIVFIVLVWSCITKMKLAAATKTSSIKMSLEASFVHFTIFTPLELWQANFNSSFAYHG